ncbi:type II toxin-antitoxin system RelE/ParE family toxin [Flavobacterium nackdongense]|uniref:Type II toxin-antitoxin system RelE/ParE family toxin n=1 Tax=Flavobacterium nackdongense TaxID=2547394 RepID=A0A4V1AGM2_9FLAO|nr:type II toxin-antitoxin system RelE/ParE family toxin [Flavobacterium nackdongense]QBN18532.1 type II toxin-antitoxin system RelE/ParE family toxin [Flavobacterium nackdongense]
MKVIWSENAETTFDVIVLYIEAKFGVLPAKKFIRKVDSVIQSISNQPYIYKSSNFNNKVRKATISKQCSLFYEINKETIQLSYFWDNRQEPML